MRIAYVCADPGVPVFGCKGASIHTQEVLRALLRRGETVTLLARRIGGELPIGLEGIRVVPLDPPEGTDALARERWLLAANGEIRAALERLGTVDLVYERHALWSYGAMEYARDTGTPSALEVNAPLIEEQSRYRELALTSEAKAAAARAFAAAGCLLCVSRAVANTVIAGGADAAKVEVLPNGVDTDRFRPDVPPSTPALDGIKTVGFVGSLRPWHGIELLIEAFARLSHDDTMWRLLIVGDGPMMPSVRASLSARGLVDRTVLTGAVRPEDVPACVTSLDIAVAPYPPDASNYFSPLKLFEYMAAGRAIVASRIGQVEEVLEHGRTGLLTPPGDVEELATAIADLGRDPARRADLGAAARRQAIAAHTWNIVVQRLIERAIPARARGRSGASA